MEKSLEFRVTRFYNRKAHRMESKVSTPGHEPICIGAANQGVAIIAVIAQGLITAIDAMDKFGFADIDFTIKVKDVQP